MDSPLIAGIIIVIVAGAIGMTCERWSWAKPLTVLAFAALTFETLASVFR